MHRTSPHFPVRALRACFLVALAAAALACLAPTAGAYVYWTNGTTQIGRANLDGSDSNPAFVTGAHGLESVEVDSRYLYWVNASDRTIGRANLDGTGVNQRFLTLAGQPWDVAVDAHHIYWVDLFNNSIGRANLDGTNADPSFITSGLENPSSVDVDAKHIYWSNAANSMGSVGRANLDGSGVQKSFIASPTEVAGVQVDAQHVYWASGPVHTIGRANIDGSNPSPSFISGGQFFDVAVDDQHVYGADYENRKIVQTSLDGTLPNFSFITSPGSIVAVAIDRGPAGRPTASPTGLALGTQPLATLSSPQAVTVTNTGHGVLNIGDVTVAGMDADDFLVSTDGCSNRSLPVGASCVLHVRFGPSASTARSAGLRIPSDDPASALSVALSGTGGSLPEGPRGQQGIQGTPGVQGIQGATGPAGPAGKVVCRNNALAQALCAITFAPGTWSVQAGAKTVAYKISRLGRTVARGTARVHRAGVTLRPQRRLSPGRYRVTLTSVNKRTHRQKSVSKAITIV